MNATQSANLASGKIQEKIKALNTPTILNRWQFKIVKPGEQPSDVYGQSWQTVPIPHTWSSADGEGWFHLDFNLPENVEGIALDGSKIGLELFLPIGAGIYLDGIVRYREPSWTDTRAVRLPLISALKTGASFTIEVRCNQADGLAQLIQSSLVISKLKQVIFDLDLVSAQIRFCAYLAEKGNHASPEKLKELEMALSSLELEALANNDWVNWWGGTQRFRDGLTSFTEEAKTYTTHLVAHSHIDMNWLWPMSETIDVCRRDFTTMTNLMDAYPEFHFSQSQAAAYHFMEEQYPDLFERIQARVADGHWDVTASTWVEGDLNMAGGESLARQLLLARRYAQEKFGGMPLICWEPDTFGHSAQLPQLLKKSGVDFYYFCRAGKNHPLFWWEGLDGSRVLAVQDLHFYGGPVTPTNIVDGLIEFAGRYRTTHGLMVYGVGDHGGGATVEDILATRVLKHSDFVPDVLLGPAAGFFQQAQAEATGVPVVQGELNTTFEGCYTSHSDIKQLNRLCENRLLSAEGVSSAAAVITGRPGINYGEEWRTFLFHQFHDILCGCAISITYREARERLEQVLAAAEQQTNLSLTSLAADVDTGIGDGLRLLVFNPLGWHRDDVVHVSLNKLNGKIPDGLMDSAGRKLPVQISGDDVVFVAEDLPPFGFNIYQLVFGQPFPVDSVIQCDTSTLTVANEHIQFQIDPHSGELTWLQIKPDPDSEKGQTLVDHHNGFLNRYLIYWEKPHTMSAWIIGEINRIEGLGADARVEIIENGPVQAVVEIHRTFLNSSLTQRIVLYRKLSRIDFHTEIDWHEHGDLHTGSPMLKVAFAPQLPDPKATYEIPYAGLERPMDNQEVPALRWSDLSAGDANLGLSILNNGKYGHQAHGETLNLTLARASYEPDINPDEGRQHFTYALYPHPGDWRQAHTTRQAIELNQPLLTTVTTAHSGKIKPGSSCLECHSESVVISAFKLAEDQPADGKTLIVRLYETCGNPGSAALQFNFPIDQVEETNLLEKPIQNLVVANGAVSLAFTPYEIKTIKVYFR